jgi:hypothetical protein
VSFVRYQPQLLCKLHVALKSYCSGGAIFSVKIRENALVPGRTCPVVYQDCDIDYGWSTIAGAVYYRLKIFNVTTSEENVNVLLPGNQPTQSPSFPHSYRFTEPRYANFYNFSVEGLDANLVLIPPILGDDNYLSPCGLPETGGEG